MAVDETKQYVDWAGLRYYDQRVKAYIDSKFTNSEDRDQFRADLEQLEDRIQTLADNFTTDKTHIYEHIEACKKRSATKEELASAIAAIHEEIKTLTDVDLSEYATKGELREVEAKIPSIDELASEAYVDAKVASIIIPEVPTNISTFTNDVGYLTAVPEEYVTDAELDAKGYITEHQSLDGLATEQFVNNKIADLDCVTSDEVESLVDKKIEAAITDGATVSSISYGTF